MAWFLLHLQLTKYLKNNMKKLIYSTLSLILMSSTLFVGCKDDKVVDPTVEKGPNISFQTGSGYSFTDGSVITGETIKIGMRLTSDVNLKTSRITVKYSSQAEAPLLDSTYTSNTKTSNRDVSFTFPVSDKGAYVFTIYATDKDNNTKSSKITITAKGPLLERGTGIFYSLRATGAAKFSAFDLNTGEAITASGTANLSMRDLVDMSTGGDLSNSWKSQNNTEFIKSTNAQGTLNGKAYSQFRTEEDVTAAWNALSSTKATQITGLDIGTTIIAKSTRNSVVTYYVIAISDINDEAGSEDDFYEIQYKN